MTKYNNRKARRRGIGVQERIAMLGGGRPGHTYFTVRRMVGTSFLSQDGVCECGYPCSRVYWQKHVDRVPGFFYPETYPEPGGA